MRLPSLAIATFCVIALISGCSSKSSGAPAPTDAPPTVHSSGARTDRNPSENIAALFQKDLMTINSYKGGAPGITLDDCLSAYNDYIDRAHQHVPSIYDSSLPLSPPNC